MKGLFQFYVFGIFLGVHFCGCLAFVGSAVNFLEMIYYKSTLWGICGCCINHSRDAR